MVNFSTHGKLIPRLGVDFENLRIAPTHFGFAPPSDFRPSDWSIEATSDRNFKVTLPLQKIIFQHKLDDSIWKELKYFQDDDSLKNYFVFETQECESARADSFLKVGFYKAIRIKISGLNRRALSCLVVRSGNKNFLGIF
jgi:hypothetical protein